MKHLIFIINPKSGVDRQKTIQHAIETELDTNTYSYEIWHTERAKHGIELAKKAADRGAFAVVAVGGDGSINDIVTGLQGTDTALAIIPKGSGNGMARTMKIPLNAAQAIQVINKGKVEHIDVGFANERLFVSNAGVAFDALISKKFAKSERRGLAVYSWLVSKYMWIYKNWKWNITIDGIELRQKAFIVNVANGQQFGYNFKIAPKASYKDGLLDVVIVKRFPRMLGGVLVLRALNGTITNSPFVEHYKAKEITVSHPDMCIMQTDGDTHSCDNKIRFTIKEGAQKVIVP